ncbi:hypothetical protein RIF29_20977 [Crotalaria pallida]|uniref:CDT1 Geminin-binding domain-containing protein n=1 Tax=Crotalaria pallida TaxID=3830 RepID=A0AAN9F3L6_CROPI
MRSSNDSASPSLKSKKKHSHNLRSSKPKSSEPVSLSSKTPEKTTPRLRNQGVALSVAEIRKVAKGLLDQSRSQEKSETESLKGKSVKRRISLPSPLKPKTTAEEQQFKIPEKYQILCDFFHSLDASIRLLQIKGKMPSFTNIVPKIECLSDRRFTHGHLAQLKFILPEAIVIKKVLVFDERMCCTKPDLHVTINRGVIESDAKPKCESKALRELFCTKLGEFCESHPEGVEIPEGELPEPFNRPKQDCLSDILKTPSSTHPPTVLSSRMLDDDIVDYTGDHTEPANREKKLSVPVQASVEAFNQQPAVASHMPPSFRRRFLQKPMLDGVGLPSDSFQPPAHPVSESNLEKNSPLMDTRTTFPVKLASEVASGEICQTTCASSGCFESSSAPLAATPSKTVEYTSTPVKLVYTPSRLMTETPAVPQSKKHYMSPDDNSSSSMNKLVRRPPRSRSLKFDSPRKNKEIENEDVANSLSANDDILDILPQNLLESIREKERIAMEERDPVISQAKRRRKMIACLPKLFNMINILFRSMKRSLITKEELVSKIISGHRDIVDKREIEEQLDLLLELVPEWISEKLTSSGDVFLGIDKMLNPETVRASLEEAK